MRRAPGVPESENEDIVDNMLRLFNDNLELDPPLTYGNIDRIHRVGKPNASHPRQILVKLSTYNARQSVYSEKKKLRNSSPPRRDPEADSRNDTTAPHEDEEEVQQPKIYLNEDLIKGERLCSGKLESLSEQRSSRAAGLLMDGFLLKINMVV